MPNTVITVENLSKVYRIGVKEERHKTLSGKVLAWLKSPLLNYKKLRSLSNFDLSKDNQDIIWAIKDVSFEVKIGEVLGIIGKNGAGKSTLLKILSHIVEPTSGKAEIHGRVASLLEVGTGFNPELTGRENTYLNGTILGMTKKEIDKKFDEIVDFSGVEKFIDTPVKRYSSGMRVRLAFAVAAHLDPEILIIDEVLAVGDAEFQKKCLGKMKDVAGEGRTVLFVSHSMGSIQQLCTHAMVLTHGTVMYNGNVEDAVKYYFSENSYDNQTVEKTIDHIPNKDFQLVHAKICNNKYETRETFECDEEIFIIMKLKMRNKIPGLYGYLQLSKKNIQHTVLVSDSNDLMVNFFDHCPVGENIIKIAIPRRSIGVGTYIVYVSFASRFNLDSFIVDNPQNILSFTVVDNKTIRGNNRGGELSTLLRWEIIEDKIER